MKKIFAVIFSVSVALVISTLSASAFEDDILKRFIYPQYDKTISMDFEDAELSDVLKIFSQQSGMNFIAADEIRGKQVTLYFEKVPVEEALNRILKANNLTYELQSDSNIFIVKSLGPVSTQLTTRVYRLKHSSVSNSKIKDTFTIESAEGEEDSSESSSSDGGGSEDKGIKEALKRVLSNEGEVVEDPRTNSLIVSDYPDRFPAIEQTIARLDVPIPQILIEVEMLDISKSIADLMGIKPGATPLSFTGGSRTHYYPWDQNELVRKGSVTGSTYTSGTIDASGLTATLQFLKTHTDTKNLARPRILTLNNETAEIMISTDEAIGIKTITQASEGSSTLSVEAERVETGVFLTVTPQANLETREITMAIQPRVIEARTGGTFQGQTFKDAEERGTKSILRVPDNQTIVIGGLLRDDSEKTRTGIPILSKIPILGMAFRHKDDNKTKRELVIFITPHILPDMKSVQSALLTQESFFKKQYSFHRESVVENALDRFER